MGKPASNEGLVLISAISGTMLPWFYMPLLLLAKRPIEKVSQVRSRESCRVRGRPTTITLHFPFLGLVSYFYFLSFN